jgi:hypothetical protein
MQVSVQAIAIYTRFCQATVQAIALLSTTK